MSEEMFGNIEAEITPHIPTDNVENDHMFLVGVVRDCSYSMKPFESPMVKSMHEFAESIKGSKSDDEMMFSLTDFEDYRNIKSGGFVWIDNMPTDYTADGDATALFDATIVAQERLFDGKGNGYMEQLSSNGVRTRGALVIFSDGYDNDSREADASDVRKAIELLKTQEILVAFVAFGDGAKGIADKIGIEPKNVLETAATASDLRKVWGIISKSAISASKNTASGGSQDAFFAV